MAWYSVFFWSSWLVTITPLHAVYFAPESPSYDKVRQLLIQKRLAHPKRRGHGRYPGRLEGGEELLVSRESDLPEVVLCMGS